MNERTQPTPLKGREGHAGTGLPVPIEPLGPPAKPARTRKRRVLPLEDLRGADLKGMDLTRRKGLLPEHLAGADLTGAKLPDEIAKFPALAQVAAISSEARKIFIGLLAACVYSWLVIGTTKDVELIVNTASSPLPIINTPIPIAGFYAIGAALLAAVYCYFHFYLQRLWRLLATLPAVFRDGTPLDDRTDPWLLTNLVRVDFNRLHAKTPPLVRLENLLAIVLAWWLVPLTLLALWARYLPAHGRLGTTWLIGLIGITVLFGRHSYRLAREALLGETPAEDDDVRVVWRRAWHEFRQLRPDRLTVGLIALLVVCSLSAFRDDPRASYTWVAKGLNALNFIGVHTYADLREVDVAERPDGWDGKDWSKVKRVDLHGRNLAFADATGAFLANADLRRANLTGAILARADLRGADLYDEGIHPRGMAGSRQGAQLQGASLSLAQLEGADLSYANLQGTDLSETNLRGADLQGADLRGANLGWVRVELDGSFTIIRDGTQLQNANLGSAQLQGASLSLAQLEGAVLRGAVLRGADLIRAQLKGADLSATNLQGADLRGADLQGADLSYANLQGADLSYANLQGVDLFGARLQGADLQHTSLRGADLRSAALWRTLVPPAEYWDYADVRGIGVEPLAKADIDETIARVSAAFADESWREAECGNYRADISRTDLTGFHVVCPSAVLERLTKALRDDHRPARPAFPMAWQSRPLVMFDCDGPLRERTENCDLQLLHLGPRKWATEQAYDEALARFLGDLACALDVPEAQTRGLARRALGLRGEPDRLWPRLFAAHVIGTDCPLAKALPDKVRSQLEQLAAQGDAAAADPGK